MENIYDFEIEEIDEVEEQEQKERFKIDNLESCNWAFRKLSKIKKEELEIEELARKEIERIEKWKESELKKSQGSKDFFESLLIEYFIQEKTKDKKFKISTPYGKVGSRKQQPKYEYKEDDFIKWAESNGFDNLLRVKKEIKKTDIKKAFSVNGNQLINIGTGEIVEGVTVVVGEDLVNVTVE